MSGEASKANVRILPGYGRRDPDAMLQAARAASLGDVIVVGRTASGELFCSASLERRDEILWLIEQAKLELLAGEF